MKTWVRKTLGAGILATGALLLAPSAAQAATGSVAVNNAGILGETTVQGQGVNYLESASVTEGGKRNGGHDHHENNGHGRGGHDGHSGHSHDQRGICLDGHVGRIGGGGFGGGFGGGGFGGGFGGGGFSDAGFGGGGFGGGNFVSGPSMGTVILPVHVVSAGFLGDVPDDDIDVDDVNLVPGAGNATGPDDVQPVGTGNGNAGYGNGNAGEAPVGTGNGNAGYGNAAKPAKVKVIKVIKIVKPAKAVKPAKVTPAKVKPAKVQPTKVQPATVAPADGYTKTKTVPPTDVLDETVPPTSTTTKTTSRG